MANYFAYGSNLSVSSFGQTCPVVSPVGTARLEHHRLAFTRMSPKWGGGVADVVASPGMTVWGVLYSIDPKCQVALDLREGNGVAYLRRPVSVIRADGTRIKAITYKVIKPVYPEMAPTDRYLHFISDGAAQHQLPDDYQRFLDSLWGERDANVFREGLQVISHSALGGVRVNPEDAVNGNRVQVQYLKSTAEAQLTRDVRVPVGACWLSESLRGVLNMPTGYYGVTIRITPV